MEKGGGVPVGSMLCLNLHIESEQTDVGLMFVRVPAGVCTVGRRSRGQGSSTQTKLTSGSEIKEVHVFDGEGLVYVHTAED